MSDSLSVDPGVAYEANRRLARTINIGLDLGSPAERGWTVDVSEHHLDLCAEAGFSAIRLVVCCEQHRVAADSLELDPTMLERIGRVIQWAIDRQLAVVLANMRDPQLMADPPRHRDRLLSCAQQLAVAVLPCGPEVMLEPLSEPQLALDPVWNAYLGDLCGAVREVDGRRTLIAGPRSYNNARFLPELVLPAEEGNLILTVHHYWPITFTMQGETWLGHTEFGDPTEWLDNTWDATVEEKRELTAGFAAVAAYAQGVHRPVFIGEFGTTVHADLPSRARWTRFNRQLAQSHGFAWACWSFGPSFALYDAPNDRWRSELLDALMA